MLLVLALEALAPTKRHARNAAATNSLVPRIFQGEVARALSKHFTGNHQTTRNCEEVRLDAVKSKLVYKVFILNHNI